MTNDRFRDSLTVDFGWIDIQTKEELNVLMRRPKTAYRRKQRTTDDVDDASFYKDRGLRVEYDNKKKEWKYEQPVSVTQDQLDGAWAWLKSKQIKETKGYKEPKVSAHYYHKQIIFRDKKTGRWIKQEYKSKKKR